MLINKAIKAVLLMVLFLNVVACDASLPGPSSNATLPKTLTPTQTSDSSSSGNPSHDATPTPSTPGSSALPGISNPTASTSSTITGMSVPPPTGPETGHPRLWLRPQDLPRLRTWAVDTNPLYKDGLSKLVAQAEADMDSKKVPDQDIGATTYVDYPTEMYAELFAFMSLISPDKAARDAYANRARTLLMFVINQAAKGQQLATPFRDPDFPVNDRSRWHGEGFPLTVDWIYSYLSSDDKKVIRQVFLNWIDSDLHASVTGHDHPEPVGSLNDPILVKDPLETRWSGNNYWTAHMRNIGLMALALDPADDPQNQLRSYLTNATGAWLYVLDYFLKHDGAGGLLPEGFEYGPQTEGFALQLLLALHTAGMDDPARLGPQVVLNNNPFWNDSVIAFLHSVSPTTTVHPDLGLVYQPAWYGDGMHYSTPDPIQEFGPLGLYDYYTGNQGRYEALRWIQTNIAPGGIAQLAGRANDSNFFQNSILYFMLFDPAAVTPSDPRPNLKLDFFSPGLNRILSRTDWGPDASWFTYKLSWNSVDHQNGDGNQFEFYRKGEWLTKERSGYDLDYGSSQNHNTLSIENDKPNDSDPTDYRYLNWQLGSQWSYVSSGSPRLVAQSSTNNYVYACGDATNLYNSAYENATDVIHASRSIVWLKPDYIVVYDRAISKTGGRFKRFWLNVPAAPAIAGNRAVVKTSRGQQLVITSLLPAGASLTSEPVPQPPLAGDQADQDPIGFRLKVEAPGGPESVQFLHVLQGADASEVPDQPKLTLSSGGTGTSYAGTVVKDTLVMFPVDLAVPFSSLTYTLQAGSGVKSQLITGLEPGQSYDVFTTNSGSQVQVTIKPGTAKKANSGGVLEF